jgi:hypothetical protein
MAMSSSADERIDVACEISLRVALQRQNKKQAKDA